MNDTTDRQDRKKKDGAPLPKARRATAAPQKGADVIHVAFGNGGGRIEAAVAPPPAAPGSASGAPGAMPPPANGREPVTELFSRKEVSKLLNVNETRLRSLDKAGIVSPSGEKSGKPSFALIRSQVSTRVELVPPGIGETAII